MKERPKRYALSSPRSKRFYGVGPVGIDAINVLGEGLSADVENVELRRFFRDWSNAIEKEWRTWPIPLSIIRADIKYSKATNVVTHNLEWLIVDAQEKGIIPNEGNHNIRRVGKDPLYAFGALMWATGELYPERSRWGNVIISDSRKTFPWDKVISVARAGLGKSRFATFINYAVAA